MHVVISSRRGGGAGGPGVSTVLTPGCSVVVVSSVGGGVASAMSKGAAATSASPSPIAAGAPGGLSLRRQLVEGSGGVGVGSPRAVAAASASPPRSQHRAPAHRVLENLLSRSDSWFGSPQRSPSPPQVADASSSSPPVVRRSEGYPGLETTLGTVPVVAEAAAATAAAAAAEGSPPPPPSPPSPAPAGRLRRRTSRRHGFAGRGAHGAVTHCAAQCRVAADDEEDEEEAEEEKPQDAAAAPPPPSPLPLPVPGAARPALPSPLPLTPLRPSAASSCSPPPRPATTVLSSSPSPSLSCGLLPQPPLVPPTIRGRSVGLAPQEGHERRLRLREAGWPAGGGPGGGYGGVRGTAVLSHAVSPAEAGLLAGEVTRKAVCLVSQPLAPCSRVLLAVSGFLDPRTSVAAGVAAAAKPGDRNDDDDDLVWVCGGAHNGRPRMHSFPFAPKRRHAGTGVGSAAAAAGRQEEGGTPHGPPPPVVLEVARSATAVTMAVVRGDGGVGGVAGPREGPSWTVPRGAAVEVRVELYPGDEAYVLDAGLTLGGPGAQVLALASDESEADAAAAEAAAASPPRLSQQASPLRWSRTQSLSQSPSPFRYRAL